MAKVERERRESTELNTVDWSLNSKIIVASVYRVDERLQVR